MIRPAGSRRGVALALAAVGGVALVAAGCGDNEAARQRRLVDEINRGARSTPAGNLPQALLVRFQENRGSGLDREGWELEILQMGGDVVLRGQVRTQGAVVPIYRPIAPGEYTELWNWLRALPFEGWEPQLDETADRPGWSKSLHADIVLGADRRILLRRRWERPLVGDPWVSDLERRFHSLAVDLAREELTRQRIEEAQAASDDDDDDDEDPDPRNLRGLPGVE